MGADSFGRLPPSALPVDPCLIGIDIGANPSAEEADEGVEEGAKTVIDVVNSFRLNFLGDEASGTRAFATKKDYQAQFKGMQHMLPTQSVRHIRSWANMFSHRLSEKSGGKTQGGRRRRGEDQGLPEEGPKLLYYKDRTKLQ